MGSKLIITDFQGLAQPYARIHPCPKCGCRVLIHGPTFTIATLKPIRWLRTRFSHGITCPKCGAYEPTINRWNRMAVKEAQHE